MPKYLTLGHDTSGREIRMSPLFNKWWIEYVDELGFTPTITQGGWAEGQGATASAGTHEGDALDLRVWDRSVREVGLLISVAREMGCAAWLRDRHHGGFTDPHVHMIPGPWGHAAPTAARQWDAYLRGRDGLASNGPDYHPRPDPLVTRLEPHMAYTDADRETFAAFVKQEKARADRNLAFQRAVSKALRADDKDRGEILDKLDALLTED